MTRDQLEATIWRTFGPLDQGTRCTAARVDAVLSAADEYAATALGEIDNYRRRQPDPVVHWRDDFNVPACRRNGRMNDPVLSTSRQHVTCGACTRTRSYKETG